MPYTILLVDDDKYFRSEFKEFMDGINVIEAANALEALSVLKKPHTIDLIIIDESMPEMRGTDLLKKIKAFKTTIYTIILTGQSSKNVAIEAVKGHADDYIEKPLTLQKVNKIKELLLSTPKGEKDSSLSGIKGKIEQVKYFAERNYDKNLTLEHVAKEVYLSPKYLSRIFKENTGMSFTEYRLQIRIEEAKKLLKETGDTIDKISYELGYQNPESFGKVFRRLTKLTPREYREQDRRRKIKKSVTGIRIAHSSKKHLDKIIAQNSKDAIMEHYLDGNIIFWSESAEKMYGWNESEILKKKIFDTFPEHKRDEFISIINKLRKTKIADTLETERITKSGKIMNIWMAIIPEIDTRGELNRFITVERDITKSAKEKQKLEQDRDVSIKEKDEAQQVVRERTKELSETKNQLEKEMHFSELGRMAAVLAHELRSPLNVIQTAVWNIKKKSKSNLFDTNLASIEKMVAQQEELVTNLLNYAHIKRPVFQKVNLIALFNECVDRVKDRFDKKKVIISKDFKGISQKNIKTDPDQLNQILSNIMMNAYEALSNVKNGRIKIEASTNHHFLTIHISDNGKGISPEDLPKVCEPFFTRRAKGTGLGLAICQEIINLFEGKLDISSQLKKGTTITIKLPLRKAK